MLLQKVNESPCVSGNRKKRLAVIRKTAGKEGQMKVEYLSPGELYPYPQNAKIHSPEQIQRIANSIKAFGWQQPIVIDKDNVVIIGHGRLFAAQELNLDSVPVVRADDLTEDQVKALRIADNKLNESPYDFSKLEEELAALDIAGFDMEQFGFADLSFAGIADIEDEKKGSMAEKYLVPPFSILYANKPDWLARKRAWVAKGLHSENGRGGDLLLIQGAIQRQTSYMGGGTSGAKPSKTTPD